MLITPVERRRLAHAHELLRADHAVLDVADAVAMSPFHFTRRFAAVFGTTPHQARIAARLERARGLLADGASVTEVCLAVGFTSLGSFSALFTRRVGATPSAYRRRALVQVAGAMPIPGCFGMLALLPRAVFEKRRAPSPARVGP